MLSRTSFPSDTARNMILTVHGGLGARTARTTSVYGVDRAVGSGPNAFPVEMAGGNIGIGGTEMLPGRF
jgi:hypothetical protein